MIALVLAAGFIVNVASDLPEEGQDRFDALQRSAREAYQEGALPQALEYYDLMQEMVPESGEVAYNRGSILLDLGQYEDAVQAFTEAEGLEFEQDFKQASLYHNRATGYTALGEYDRALFDYDRAYDIDPEDARILNNRGVVLLRLGDRDEAIRSFEFARELDPGYADPVFHLGTISYDEEEYEIAVSLFSDVLEIDANYGDARFNKGNALYHAGRYRDALEEFLYLHREDPENEDVLVNLGLSALAAASGEPGNDDDS